MPTLRHFLLYCIVPRFRGSDGLSGLVINIKYQYQYQCLISTNISPDPFMYSTHQVLLH